jgi:hypothetical protein
MTDRKASAKTDGGAQQVQDQMDKETEQGFRGDNPDPRPNEDYTVAGAVARRGENLGQAGEPAPGETNDESTAQ